jgi:hypothetical protein
MQEADTGDTLPVDLDAMRKVMVKWQGY